MEDFRAVFLRCIKDVEVLHEQGRRIASMHFGGVAVECLLKHMLVSSFPLGATREWYRNPEGIPVYGHRIERPGHDYHKILEKHSALQSRVDDDLDVQQWLNDVKKPNGCFFIDMRYSNEEPEVEMYDAWWDKYQQLMGWLQDQILTL